MGEILSINQSPPKKLLALNPGLSHFVFKTRINKGGEPWGYLFEFENEKAKKKKQIIILADNSQIISVMVLNW